jgi:hypothetical protein
LQIIQSSLACQSPASLFCHVHDLKYSNINNKVPTWNLLNLEKRFKLFYFNIIWTIFHGEKFLTDLVEPWNHSAFFGTVDDIEDILFGN